MAGQQAPLIFDRTLLRRRRTRALACAGYPDFLEARAAREIADRLSVMLHRFETTLVVGTASGPLAATVAATGRVGRAILADIVAEGPAGRVDVVLDPELLPLVPESLDAVVCGLGLERLNDLPGALAQIRRALKPDGLFLAVLLGGDTLIELRHAWVVAESELTGGASPRIAPFADVRELGGLLQRAGFALPVADSDRLTARYSGGLALMRELKAMGLANPLDRRRRKPVGKALMARAAAVYDATFADPDGRVRATFELVALTGWAPAETQPKPLRPGSARMRLADALGATEHRLKR